MRSRGSCPGRGGEGRTVRGGHESDEAEGATTETRPYGDKSDEADEADLAEGAMAGTRGCEGGRPGRGKSARTWTRPMGSRHGEGAAISAVVSFTLGHSLTTVEPWGWTAGRGSATTGAYRRTSGSGHVGAARGDRAGPGHVRTGFLDCASIPE